MVLVRKFRVLIFAVLMGMLFMYSSCSTSAFFYVPYKELKHYPDTLRYNVQDIYFRAPDSMMLHGWFIRPRSGKITGTILHFHGNAGNVSYHYPFLEPLLDAGFQCITWDYEGFGKSAGKPSQEHVLEDCHAALNYARTKPEVIGTKLILFGQSLGAHLALVTAAKEGSGLKAVVAEGAFTGHKDIAAYTGWHHFLAPPFITRCLIPSRYDAKKVVDKITIPILFIHSTEDRVCPYFMGKKLYDKAQGSKELWEIKGNHICASLLYKDEFVKHFLKLAE